MNTGDTIGKITNKFGLFSFRLLTRRAVRVNIIIAIQKDKQMATSSYYKAAEWAKSVKVNKIESLEWLTGCTIRQLRAIADKINHEIGGWIFCQATLGKTLGRLTKAELAVAIWDFISLKRSAPRRKYFEIDECGNVRIVTERPGSDASPWTTNIGFNDYNSAEKVQKFLHKGGMCNASVIRISKRCEGWKYELKVWLLSEKALGAIIAKENVRLNAERQLDVKDLPKLTDNQLKALAVNKGINPNQPRFKLLQELGYEPPFVDTSRMPDYRRYSRFIKPAIFSE